MLFTIQLYRKCLGPCHPPTGESRHLQVEEGESIAAVRRRLGAAARQAGLDLKIRRSGEEIYFWVEEGDPEKTEPTVEPIVDL